MQHLAKLFLSSGLVPIFLSAVLAGCAGPLARKDSYRSGQNPGADTGVMASKTPPFESSLELVEDKEVSNYLARLASRLSGRSAQAKLVKSEDGKWNSYAATAGSSARLYLSTGVLKAARYETELAAALAFELGFLVRGIQHAPEAIITPEHREVACEEGVAMLYSAGIDPRGMTALLDLYARSPKTSPIPVEEIDSLKEVTRAGIAKQAPLMNPVVKSAEFSAIRKKLERL